MRKEMHRRDFLRFSSIALVGVAAATWNQKMFGATAPALGSLAIGCASIDEADRARVDPFDVALVSADRLNASDGTFLRRGALIQLAGLGGGNCTRGVNEVNAHFPVDGTDVPVTVWGKGGNTVSFKMPIEVEQRLRFTFGPCVPASSSRRRIVSSAPATDGNRDLVLSLMNEPGVVKLARAYYAIVPLVAGAPEPKWSSYTLLRSGGGQMLMHERRDGFAQPVQFEHFVFRADYANPGF